MSRSPRRPRRRRRSSASSSRSSRRVQPEVAQIRTDSGLGSGVIFDAKGNIVTNAHVVEGASTLSVTLADGRRFTARLVGSYAPDDLAVISIGAGHALRPAAFANSSKVDVGDLVLAVGNPLGFQSSVTDGIVSGVGRDVSEGQGVVLPSAIQTSAPINPGNSGGALVDLDGRVIGIPTLAAGNPQSGGTAAGIGFAVPSNVVTDIAGQIVRHGRVVNSHRAALGVRLADNPSGGAVVVAVTVQGPGRHGGARRGRHDRGDQRHARDQRRRPRHRSCRPGSGTDGDRLAHASGRNELDAHGHPW